MSTIDATEIKRMPSFVSIENIMSILPPLARLLFVMLLVTPFSASTSAAPTAWRLRDVVFDDGGTATGTFVYDPSTMVVSTWSITVAGGRQPPFFDFTFHPGNSGASGGDDRFEFSTTSDHLLRLGIVRPLPSRTTATVPLKLDFGESGECVYPCDPAGTIRSLHSGYLIHIERDLFAPVPTISVSAAVVLLIVLLIIGLIAARH